jgi:hypothetical protein
MKLRRFFERGTNPLGSVTHEWHDEARTVIVQRFVGNWSWMAFFWSIVDVGRLLNDAKHPIDLIFDLESSAGMPPGMLQVGRFNWIWNDAAWSPNLRHMVVVGTDPKIREVFTLRRWVAPDTLKYFRHVATFDEALTVLRDWDMTDQVR